MRYCFTVSAAVCALAGTATAAPSIWFAIDNNNPIPGTTAYSIFVDGDGQHFQSAVLVMDLSAGSVYNGVPDSYLPQHAFWGVLPDLQWDTWFGIPGIASNAISGGGADLGGGPLNASGSGNDAISVTWFNIDVTDTAAARIANITLTDDAAGSWDFQASFFSNTVLQLSGVVADLPEPGAMMLLGVGGLGLLRRS